MTAEAQQVLKPIPLKPLGDEPLVSVLISNYNYEHYITEALQSVLDQTYPHFEVIVCDDGSTDGSVAAIEAVAARDPRVTLISKENGGQATGFNVAFSQALGDIICLLDADDTFFPTKIASVVDRMKEGTCGVFVHRLVRIDGQGNEIVGKHGHPSLKEGWIAEDVLVRGGRWGERQVPVPEPTTAMSFRREVGELIFPIPESLRICADAFVACMLPLMTTVGASDESLGNYRIHGANSYSRQYQTAETLRGDLERLNIVTDEINVRFEHLGLGDVSLDVWDNMQAHELNLYIGLLEGRPRRTLLLDYLKILKRMVKGDDLRRGVGQVVAAALYAIALLLPQNKRLWWLFEARRDLTWTYRRAVKRLRRLTRSTTEQGA